MKKNFRKGVTTKDSCNWLTDTQQLNSAANESMPKAYFCEYCFIIQSEPTKHCKLCEGCCCKFDHHCLFITKCVGVKNHRFFIVFLVVSLLAVPFFLSETYRYYSECREKVTFSNVGKEELDQISFVYYFFASQKLIRVGVLSILSIFFTIMLTMLLVLQLKVVSLGFTSQFYPPTLYYKLNKNLKSWPSSIAHRLNNLYIFFLNSNEQNIRIYFEYRKEHLRLMDVCGPIAPPYPTDSKDSSAINLLGVEMMNNGSSKHNVNKTFEIDLD